MLAIGIYYEQGFTASVAVISAYPLVHDRHSIDFVVGKLANHNENDVPDEVLLIRDSNVVGHWVLGVDYDCH